MWRIIITYWILLLLTLVLRFVLVLQFLSWNELFISPDLGWLVAGCLFGLWLLSIPKPVTEFIYPPMSPWEQMIRAKLYMVRDGMSTDGTVRVYVANRGWIEGRHLDLSRSWGVLLLETNPGSPKPNEEIFFSDIVSVPTDRNTLGALLADRKDPQAIQVST